MDAIETLLATIKTGFPVWSTTVHGIIAALNGMAIEVRDDHVGSVLGQWSGYADNEFLGYFQTLELAAIAAYAVAVSAEVDGFNGSDTVRIFSASRSVIDDSLRTYYAS